VGRNEPAARRAPRPGKEEAMTVVRATLGLLAALLLLIPGAGRAQGTAVTGTINYTARSALPATAQVTVQIARADPGTFPQVVAEQRFITNGAQVPFRFTVPYDPARIDPNGTYIIQGSIAVNGTIRFATAQPFPVITRGAPVTGVAVTVVQVGDLPASSAGTGMLALAGLLGAAFVGVRLLRRAAGPRG